MEYQNKYNLPPELVTVVDRELDASEQVEWVGQPIAARFARQAIPMAVFGIPWTAFAIFWTLTASGMTTHGHGGGLQWLFALWGVPFILVGFGLLTSPYWMRLRAKRMAYLLTERRAIIISLGFRSNVGIRSFEASALADLRRRERADGSGDLIFTRDPAGANRGRNTPMAVGFMAIRDVKDVEDRVRRLIQQARNAPVS